MRTSFVGRTVGQLTVVREVDPVVYTTNAGYPNRVRRYFCQCACGRTTLSRHNDIANGRAKSCGCLRRKAMSEHPIGRKEKGSSYLRYMYSYYVRNARVKGLPFALTGDQFRALVRANCFYCGAEPTPAPNQSDRKRNLKHVFYGTIPRNGIDKANPALGYVYENCVSCCKTCNIAKHTMTQVQFRDWVLAVHAHFAKP